MAARSEQVGYSIPLEGRLAWNNSLSAETSQGRRRVSLHLAAGSALIGLVILTALFAPQIAPYAPDVMLPGARLLPPSTEHWFGTDAFGRDLFSRVIYGARLALKLSLLASLISAVPGLAFGMLAGYFRGWVDQVLSRLVDVWLALPGLLLALLIIARTGPSLDGAILALGLTGIPGYYRLMRAGAISLSQMPYVEASRALGAGGARMIFLHILPNLFSSLIVLTSLRLGTYLLAGGSLSFIGLGAQAPLPEWGALLAEGRDYVDTAWWMFAFPLLAISITVIGYNLLGDGLSDRFSKHSRAGQGW
jgi:ABC-type dipeptide/oligopeptide/nickel transport system permease subunit